MPAFGGVDGSEKESPPTCPSINRTAVAQASGIDRILRQAHIVPVVDEDSIVHGFRFVYVRSCGFFESIGFRTDDVLLTVDNFPVRSPVGLIRFFNALMGEESFVVEILRDGKSNPIYIK